MSTLFATIPTNSVPKRRSPRPAPKSKPVTINPAQYERLTVIAQVRRAFLPGARLAGFTGLIIGGFVPVATWTVVHYEVSAMPALWLLVAGGLIYSALTVYPMGKVRFRQRRQSAGLLRSPGGHPLLWAQPCPESLRSHHSGIRQCHLRRLRPADSQE